MDTNESDSKDPWVQAEKLPEGGVRFPKITVGYHCPKCGDKTLEMRSESEQRPAIKELARLIYYYCTDCRENWTISPHERKD